MNSDREKELIEKLKNAIFYIVVLK